MIYKLFLNNIEFKIDEIIDYVFILYLLYILNILLKRIK